MPAVTGKRASAPRQRVGALNWLRHNLFGSPWQTILTVIAAAVTYEALAAFFKWAVWDAAFGLTTETCRGAEGACWSSIAANFALYMLGPYPFEERWRAWICLVVVLALVVSACFDGVRRWRPIRILWPAAIVSILILLGGGDWLGLPAVATNHWGGLLVTLILAINGIVFAFPLGILLALGRQSKTMPAVRLICIGFIEVVRGVPLISVLFLASFMLPLFLPSGFTVDNLVRAQVGIILYQSAFLAEVARGGFQAVPHGQMEAAVALGLRPAHTMAYVMLPQALRMAIPGIVNEFIAILKETSLVSIIGTFDLLGIANLTIRNPEWAAQPFEAYTFIALIYWSFCFSMSQVSRLLEKRLSVRHH